MFFEVAMARVDLSPAAEPMQPAVYPVAVRELVGFLSRSGSLDSHAGILRLLSGTRLHKLLQSRAGAGYVPEVS